MKKNIVTRCMIGAPIGLALSFVITIAISYFMKDGNYYPVVPELANELGSELNAVTLQAVFSLLYGAAWAGASAIWEIEGWSILKQTLVHLVICSLATFPTAYLMRWMEHSVSGVLTYFGIFLAIYAAIWLSQYTAMKRRVESLNAKLVSEKTSDPE